LLLCPKTFLPALPEPIDFVVSKWPVLRFQKDLIFERYPLGELTMSVIAIFRQPSF
jgi:hypothetical protein